jgi:hypothetical protein
MKRNGGQSSRRPARTCVLRAACLHDHATARPEGLDLPLNLSLFAALGHRCWPASTAHRPLSHPLALPLSSSRTHPVVSFPSRLSSPRGHRLPRPLLVETTRPTLAQPNHPSAPLVSLSLRDARRRRSSFFPPNGHSFSNQTSAQPDHPVDLLWSTPHPSVPPSLIKPPY